MGEGKGILGNYSLFLYVMHGGWPSDWLSLDQGGGGGGGGEVEGLKVKNLKKRLKPWYMGTYLGVHNKSYPMNTNMTGLKCLSIGRVNISLLEGDFLQPLSYRMHKI